MSARSDGCELPLSALLAFTPMQAVQFLKEKLEELLDFRRTYVPSPLSDEFSTSQQYEKALQKLESEVRNHFSVQQQLRLHIETMQGKYEEELRKKDEAIAGLQRKAEGGNRYHATDRDETPSRLDASADRSFEHISAIKDVLNLRTTNQGESDRIILGPQRAAAA